MDDKLFKELLAAVKDAADIADGKKRAGRIFRFNDDRSAVELDETILDDIVARYITTKGIRRPVIAYMVGETQIEAGSLRVIITEDF